MKKTVLRVFLSLWLAFPATSSLSGAANAKPVSLRVLKLWLDNTKLEAGGTARLHFKVELNGVELSQRKHCWGTFSPIHFSHVSIAVPGTIEKEGDGQYGISFAISPWVPSGDYYLSKFALFDDHENMSLIYAPTTSNGWPLFQGENYEGTTFKIPFLIASVYNPGHEDVTPPTFVSFASSSLTVKAGGKLPLSFIAYDDLSGIDTPERSYTSWKRLGPGDPKELVALGGAVNSLGLNHYEIALNVPANTAPGDYVLTGFLLQDKAYNSTWLGARLDLKESQLTGKERYVNTDVPLVFLQITKP